MERISVSGFDPNHEIDVSWDNPLATFTALITDREIEAAIERGDADEEESDPIVLWAGTVLGELSTISALKEVLSPYAELPDAVVEQLQQQHDAPYIPSPLQQQTRQFILEHQRLSSNE